MFGIIADKTPGKLKSTWKFYGFKFQSEIEANTEAKKLHIQYPDWQFYVVICQAIILED